MFVELLLHYQFEFFSIETGEALIKTKIEMLADLNIKFSNYGTESCYKFIIHGTLPNKTSLKKIWYLALVNFILVPIEF